MAHDLSKLTKQELFDLECALEAEKQRRHAQMRQEYGERMEKAFRELLAIAKFAKDDGFDPQLHIWDKDSSCWESQDTHVDLTAFMDGSCDFAIDV